MSTCCDPVPVNATTSPPEVLVPSTTLLTAPVLDLDSDDYALSTDTPTGFKRTLWSKVAQWIFSTPLLTLPLVGTVARTLASAVTDQLSVKWFGAKGDGTTDDTAALQAAINAGLPLYVPVGIYVVSTLTLQTGTRLYGPGTLRLRTGAPAHLLAGAVADVRIDGLTLDGNTANMGSTALPETFAAINLTATTPTELGGIVIENTKVLRYPGDGLVVNGAIGASIAGNEVQNCQGHGITVAGSAPNAAGNLSTVRGNRVRNVGAAGIILMGDNRRTACTGNVVSDWNSSDYNPPATSNGDGITCYDPENDSMSIAGNVVINTGKAQGGHGIHFGGDDVACSGNAVSGAPASGIYMRSNSGANNGGTVTGNTIQGGGTDAAECAGIFARLMNGISITGNTVRGHGKNGVLLQQVSGGSIANNAIVSPGAWGVRVNDSAAAASSRLTIAGNTIVNPTEDGIRLDLCSDSRIDGNTVVNANLAGGKYHVYIADGQARNAVDNNTLRDGGNGAKIRFPADAISVNRASRNLQSSSSTFQDKGAIASAATIRLDEAWDTWVVSGTTAIATINGAYDGRTVTLQFTGASGANETGNIFLNGATFTAAANKVLQLTYSASASKWLEVGRT